MGVSMHDLKFYGKVLFAVAAAAFVLSRVMPGIGMRVGIRPDPLGFMPYIPFVNPVPAGRSTAPVSSEDPSKTLVNSTYAAMA